MSVNDSARSGGIIMTYSVLFNMKVCCMSSLESPHRDDSKMCIHYTIFQFKKENHSKLS